MTTRLSLFDSPFLLGFDHFERTLDRITKSTNDSYPPYNIEQTGDNQLRITLAVAGFSMDDLSVQIEDNQLVIRGKRQESEKDKIFIHRGIAMRQFQRSFVLADSIQIDGAHMDNGLLHIEMSREEPEIKIKKVPIQQPEKKSQKTIDVDHSKQNE